MTPEAPEIPTTRRAGAADGSVMLTILAGYAQAGEGDELGGRFDVTRLDVGVRVVTSR